MHLPRTVSLIAVVVGLVGSTVVAATGAGATPPASATLSAASKSAPSYNGLANTPPMGWNDWSYYQCGIDEKLILDQGKALVSSGMAAAGYNTVTTDDCWLAASRDANGNLQADPTLFPDGMAYVGAQLHAMGLKFGIYEDSGTETCGGYPGSWNHYSQDAKLFASWGVDYLKLDGCNVPDVPGQTSEQTYQQAYTEMSKALIATGRPIVFSDSAPAYFQGTPQWDSVIDTSSKISNLWREGADTALGQQSGAQKWSAIAYNYSYNVGLGKYAGPGHWNDPDFLLTGDSGLTTTEMQSQMSLWAEMAAPLISSTDLTKLSPAAHSILTNKAVIAVDQDKKGVQGSIVQSGTDYDVLAKPLANGDVSVVLFNKSAAAQTISTTASNIGLSSGSPYRLSDLVTGKATSTSQVIAANVAPHGTVMYRVHPYTTATLAPAATLYLSNKAFKAGKPSTVTVTLADHGSTPITSGTVRLAVPAGWSVQPKSQTFGKIKAGSSASAIFQVISTKSGPGVQTHALTATVNYSSKTGNSSLVGELDSITNTPYPSLAAAFNNVAITSQSDVTPGNFDGSNNSYSAEQLAAVGVTPGSTVTSGGASFSWPNVAAGTPDNVEGSGDTVLFTGQGSTLAFLGSEAGDVTDTVTVTYTDGSTSTGTLGFPNWSFSDATEFGATLAISTTGRNTPAGYADAAYAYRVFSNTVPIDSGKRIASVTLPTDPDIHLFAISTSK